MSASHRPPYRRRPSLADDSPCPVCRTSAGPIAVRVYNGYCRRSYPLHDGTWLTEQLYRCRGCGQVWLTIQKSYGGKSTILLPGVDTDRPVWWVEPDHQDWCVDPTCRIWRSRELLRMLALGSL